MLGKVERLGYVGVGASDLEAWEDYATNLLGVAVQEKEDDGTLLLRHDKHHYRLAVHPDPVDDLLYIGWQVTDDEALAAFRAHLERENVSFTVGDNDKVEARRVGELIELKDPNGVCLEVFHSPLIDYVAPFQSSRPIKGFLTGEFGLGHMVIGVDNFVESKKFYREILGMRVSDYIKVARGNKELEIVFLHCNGRHHSIGFGNGAGGLKRLAHIMLEVNDMDDVGSTYDICLKRGIESTTLGRHPNDRMISFYMASPSGWQFEYGYGARCVSDEEAVERFTTISEWGHLRNDGLRYGDTRKKAQ